MATYHSISKRYIGRRFGRLIVIERAPNRPGNSCAIWRCLCECGNEKLKSSYDLKRNHAPSCGCWGRERTTASTKTHGKTETSEYERWASMKQRCNNPKHKMYSYYGGRGITVCESWNESFEAFLSDMGEAPPGMSLDRMDNDGNYEPGNCRWATATTQIRNRSNCHYLTARGETLLLSDWAAKVGVRKGTIANRIRYGWSDEEAIFGKNAIPS